jgi:hypothetical protein
MHRPRVFCSREENDSNFRATRTVSAIAQWLSGKGRRRGMAAAQADAELGENQQAAVGKLQAAERREQRTPLVEIARQNLISSWRVLNRSKDDMKISRSSGELIR